MMTRRAAAPQAGFTLMDVMAAILLTTIGVTGLLAMQMASLNANNRARELMEAAQLCQDKIEQLRLHVAPPPLPPLPAAGYEDVDSRGCVYNATPPDPRAWCATPTPGLLRYQRRWIGDPMNVNRFEVRVDWVSSDGSPHQSAVSYVR